MTGRHLRLRQFARKDALRVPLGLAVLFLGLLFVATAQATTLDTLLENNQLRASVTIDTEGDLYQRAAFVLAVEVATPRWFSRGTRVDDFRVPGAVVRPISNFADNSSLRIAGETWSVQRWRFRVYPSEPGKLTFSPLKVFVSVNSDAGVVEGTLKLAAPSVQIVPPPGAADQGDRTWIATPRLQIEQQWDGTLESYLPGDAITRKRRFVVEEAPAMMLEASPLETIDGVSFYVAPARVNDVSDRGKLTGTREETLVITFERPGSYEIPGLAYRWFNTTTQRFETLSLPALEVLVSAADTPLSDAQIHRGRWPDGPLLLLASGATVLVFLLWLGRSSPRAKQLIGFLSTRLHRYRCQQAYLGALKRQDSAACIQLLYGHMTEAGDLRHLMRALHSLGDKTSLRQLLAHAYGNGSELPERKAAMSLWHTVADSTKARPRTENLALNPCASDVQG